MFVDGQNLFFAARHALGSTWPDLDVAALAEHVCGAPGWSLTGVTFYTGVPNERRDPRWHAFWSAKLLAMQRAGVRTYARVPQYVRRPVALPHGRAGVGVVAEEKGIDVRLALDVVGAAYRGELDVAVVLSQDQDFVAVGDEIREIARRQGRWIKIASAFPAGGHKRRSRGIDKTDWIPIDRATYDACRDPRDYGLARPADGPRGREVDSD